MRVEVVTADGKAIAKPLTAGSAGGQNAACATSPIKELDDSENDFSIGVIITFGQLRIVDLGDLTWARERELMCPVDKLGHVDIYVASHHGVDKSGSPALLNAIAPRVAIMDNGGHKGGQPGAWDIIQHSPRLAALWQLHTVEAPDGHNVPDARIANLKGPDAGNYLQLAARKDGSFSVTNRRTGGNRSVPSKIRRLRRVYSADLAISLPSPAYKPLTAARLCILIWVDIERGSEMTAIGRKYIVSAGLALATIAIATSSSTRVFAQVQNQGQYQGQDQGPDPADANMAPVDGSADQQPVYSSQQDPNYQGQQAPIVRQSPRRLPELRPVRHPKRKPGLLPERQPAVRSQHLRPQLLRPERQSGSQPVFDGS